MRRALSLIFFAAFMFASCGTVGWIFARAQNHDPAHYGDNFTAKRIVSLSPSVTEIVFALGCGNVLVGATNFCTNPPEATRIARVGGYLDPNYEAIAALAPDLVIVLSVHAQAVPVLQSLGVATLSVDHTSVEGILHSIESIGNVCDAREKAARLSADLNTRLERVKRIASILPTPRVMLSIERPLGSLKEVYIVGKDGFLDALLTLAGGRNVYEAPIPRFPSLGAEGILKLDPEVIIELRVGAHTRAESDAAVLADWATLPALRAVRDGRVYVLRDPSMVIPGPRFAEIAERLLATIHPECAEVRS